MDGNSVFNTLSKINVNDKVEEKNGLSYLSWAYAWGEVKKLYSNVSYKIYERDTQYGPCNYFTDGKTAWVKTGVTIEGVEYIEELPVMDYKNKSITLDKLTSFDVNKAIQRSLTKAIARHGLGFYIYAGEDLPEDEKQQQTKLTQAKSASGMKPKQNDDELRQKLIKWLDSFCKQKHDYYVTNLSPIFDENNLEQYDLDEVKTFYSIIQNSKKQWSNA